MENEVRNDFKVSGSGSFAGGIFDNVKISGSAKINGDLDCNLFNTSGSSRVNGNVKTKDLGVSGSSHIFGNVAAEDIHISGSASIDGNINAGCLKVSGSSKIKGKLSAQKINISGGINISEDCDAEQFEVHGGFEIGGLLNADTVKINIGGKCHAKEIGGENIEVKQFNPAFAIITKIIGSLFDNFNMLNCDVIEGDNIYLENTTAKIVRGNNITIGKECKIDLVEYKNQLQVIENGSVGEQRKAE